MTQKIFLSVAGLLLCFSLATAQNTPQQPPESDTQQIHALRKKIDDQEAQLQRLQQLIERQQQALEALQQKIELASAKPPTSVATNSIAPQIMTVAVSPNEVQAAQANTRPATATPTTKAQGQDTVTPLAGWDREHAYFRSADGSFESKITGFGQFDFRGYQSGTNPNNTYLIRRARLALEGKVMRYFDYKFEMDFADQPGNERDMFVRLHRIDEAQLSFGQFKEPFSQEELRSDATMDFVERSMVNNLAPARSPGLMLSGVVHKGRFEYQLGSFTGKGLITQNNNGTPENVLRLKFNPWRGGGNFFSRGLIFGGAYAQGRTLNGQSFRGLSESRSVTFFDPETVNGKVIRANGELTWLLGPAAIRAEYDQVQQQRIALGPKGTDLPGVVGKGTVAQVTYLLTREDKPELAIVSPKRSLFATESASQGWGAWELKFRFADLQINDGTSRSNRAQSYYSGVNWYLNRFVRYMFDVGLERYKDPRRAPRPGDQNFVVIQNRVQIAF